MWNSVHVSVWLFSFSIFLNSAELFWINFCQQLKLKLAIQGCFIFVKENKKYIQDHWQFTGIELYEKLEVPFMLLCVHFALEQHNCYVQPETFQPILSKMIQAPCKNLQWTFRVAKFHFTLISFVSSLLIRLTAHLHYGYGTRWRLKNWAPSLWSYMVEWTSQRPYNI